MKLLVVGPSDYYDGTRKERRSEKGIEYRRKKQITFSIKSLQGIQGHLATNEKIYFLIDNLPSIKRLLNKNQKIVMINWFRVAFAGVLYTGAEITTDKYTQYVYTFEDFKAIIGVKDKDYKPIGFTYDLEEWAKFNMVPNNEYQQVLIDHHIIVAVAWNKPHYANETWIPNTIEINGNLKEVSFDKVLDAKQAYETLANFVDTRFPAQR